MTSSSIPRSLQRLHPNNVKYGQHEPEEPDYDKELNPRPILGSKAKGKNRQSHNNSGPKNVLVGQESRSNILASVERGEEREQEYDKSR